MPVEPTMRVAIPGETHAPVQTRPTPSLCEPPASGREAPRVAPYCRRARPRRRHAIPGRTVRAARGAPPTDLRPRTQPPSGGLRDPRAASRLDPAGGRTARLALRTRRLRRRLPDRYLP